MITEQLDHQGARYFIVVHGTRAFLYQDQAGVLGAHLATAGQDTEAGGWSAYVVAKQGRHLYQTGLRPDAHGAFRSLLGRITSKLRAQERAKKG